MVATANHPPPPRECYIDEPNDVYLQRHRADKTTCTQATGWFLSHGGFNSTVETINAGVPLIGWPFIGDQPLNTIHLTETLDTGYELLEVRTGNGLRPVYRTGKAPTGSVEAVRAEAADVLQRAFGEEGRAKRARLLALKERLDAAWGEGGASRRDVEAFLDTLCA